MKQWYVINTDIQIIYLLQNLLLYTDGPIFRDSLAASVVSLVGTWFCPATPESSDYQAAFGKCCLESERQAYKDFDLVLGKYPEEILWGDCL